MLEALSNQPLLFQMFFWSTLVVVYLATVAYIYCASCFSSILINNLLDLRVSAMGPRDRRQWFRARKL